MGCMWEGVTSTCHLSALTNVYISLCIATLQQAVTPEKTHPTKTTDEFMQDEDPQHCESVGSSSLLLYIGAVLHRHSNIELRL